MSTTSPTFQLELLGLREDNPRDFLAALGLLRIFSAEESKSEALLHWSQKGSPIFHLDSSLSDAWHTALETTLKALITDKTNVPPYGQNRLQEWLADEFSSRSQNFILQGTAINNTVFGAVASIRSDCVRIAFQNSLALENPALRRISISLISSLLSQVHTSFDKKKMVLKSDISDLSFANKQGQKYLLYGLQQAVRGDLDFRILCSETPKKTVCQNFRWNPAEYRPGAYLGGSADFLDATEANVAAVFGMTFFPVVDQTKESVTGGFSRNWGEDACFRWPIWDTPLSGDLISTLLLSPSIHSSTELDQSTIRQTGCLRVWSSRRFSADKSLYFAPAESVI